VSRFNIEGAAKYKKWGCIIHAVAERLCHSLGGCAASMCFNGRLLLSLLLSCTMLDVLGIDCIID
jgi:hypothetical protein